MRVSAVILAVALAGCGEAGDERLPILDQTFTLAPGTKDTWTFIVFSEGPAYVEVTVEISGGTADVLVVEEGKTGAPTFVAAGLAGKKVFGGNLAAGAFRLMAANVGATPCKVHALVIKDLEARK